MRHQSDNPGMEECIQHCLYCHHICLETAMNHCLPISGMDTGQEHFRLMMTCAEICQTCANLMLSGSDLHPLICGVCAEICRRCAASCRNIAGMEDCARLRGLRRLLLTESRVIASHRKPPKGRHAALAHAGLWGAVNLIGSRNHSRIRAGTV